MRSRSAAAQHTAATAPGAGPNLILPRMLVLRTDEAIG